MLLVPAPAFHLIAMQTTSGSDSMQMAIHPWIVCNQFIVLYPDKDFNCMGSHNEVNDHVCRETGTLNSCTIVHHHHQIVTSHPEIGGAYKINL